MKVITAPDPIHYAEGTTVFLAGGITNCPEWQQAVISLLDDVDCTILNPRRLDFPIGDPSAAREQIEWEFHALNTADIISIWFCNADSDQPICMYELGRHLALRSRVDQLNTLVVGIASGYRRQMDVVIQTRLIDRSFCFATNLTAHAEDITGAVERLDS